MRCLALSKHVFALMTAVSVLLGPAQGAERQASPQNGHDALPRVRWPDSQNGLPEDSMAVSSSSNERSPHTVLREYRFAFSLPMQSSLRRPEASTARVQARA